MNQLVDEDHQAEGGSDPVDKRLNRRTVLQVAIAAGAGIAAGDGATALLFGSEQSEQNQSTKARTSELLDLGMQAHGGLERWRQVQSLDVRVSTTGGLFRLSLTFPLMMEHYLAVNTMSRHSFWFTTNLDWRPQEVIQ
jgi:hypothetical protein